MCQKASFVDLVKRETGMELDKVTVLHSSLASCYSRCAFPDFGGLAFGGQPDKIRKRAGLRRFASGETRHPPLGASFSFLGIISLAECQKNTPTIQNDAFVPAASPVRDVRRVLL